MFKFPLHDNYIFDLFTVVQIWYCKTFEFGLGSSFRKVKWIPAKIGLFFIIGIVNKDIKCKKKKKKIANKHNHNIMRIFDVFGFQEIRKIQNDVKTLWNYNLAPSFSPKNKILSVLAKDSLKIEIELFSNILYVLAVFMCNSALRKKFNFCFFNSFLLVLT